MFPFEPDNIVDFSKDFYKQYPEAKAIFHPTPSDTMWAYVLLYHENSPFKNLSLKRKLQEVERVATRKIKYEGHEEAEKLFEEGSTDANKKALTRCLSYCYRIELLVQDLEHSTNLQNLG